jgi:hypothetical protein
MSRRRYPPHETNIRRKALRFSALRIRLSGHRLMVAKLR